MLKTQLGNDEKVGYGVSLIWCGLAGVLLMLCTYDLVFVCRLLRIWTSSSRRFRWRRPSGSASTRPSAPLLICRGTCMCRWRLRGASRSANPLPSGRPPKRTIRRRRCERRVMLCCAVLCLLLWTMSHMLTRVISVEAAGERGQDTSDYLAERKRGAR